MPRTVQYLFGTLLAAFLVGGPVCYSWYTQDQIRHFRAIKDEVLYRSGQMSLEGLKQVLRDHEIKTVITLRDATHFGEPPPDLEEEKFCKDQEVTYVRIPPRAWWAADGSVPAQKGVDQFLKVMDNPANYPVLIHCFGGIHRTGAYCAIYRMEYEHWSNDRAINELREGGYTNLDEEWDLLTYLENYRPRWRKYEEEAPPMAQRNLPWKSVKRKKKKLGLGSKG